MKDEEETDSQDKSQESKKTALLPTIQYFRKTYANSIDNDQKAVKIFKDYESKERIRRLQSELQAIQKNQVTDQYCDIALGKKRKARYETYQRWAELMLMWIAQYKN